MNSNGSMPTPNVWDRMVEKLNQKLTSIEARAEVAAKAGDWKRVFASGVMFAHFSALARELEAKAKSCDK